MIGGTGKSYDVAFSVEESSPVSCAWLKLNVLSWNSGKYRPAKGKAGFEVFSFGNSAGKTYIYIYISMGILEQSMV